MYVICVSIIYKYKWEEKGWYIALQEIYDGNLDCFADFTLTMHGLYGVEIMNSKVQIFTMRLHFTYRFVYVLHTGNGRFDICTLIFMLYVCGDIQSLTKN